jgi:hypothetical protein
MVLGIPYLYDRKEIFYREHNQYHLIKEGNEYVVHANNLKLRKEDYARNTPIIVPN